jgi:hypothetical protein
LLLTYPLSEKYQIPLVNFNMAASTAAGALAGIVFGVVLGCFFLFSGNNPCGMTFSLPGQHDRHLLEPVIQDSDANRKPAAKAGLPRYVHDLTKHLDIT